MRRGSLAIFGLVLVVLAAVACEDDGPVSEGTAGGAGRGGVEPCLDPPAQLPRPPASGLPCELLPPGFSP